MCVAHRRGWINSSLTRPPTPGLHSALLTIGLSLSAWWAGPAGSDPLFRSGFLATPTWYSDECTLLAIGDLNGDGRPDLVTAPDLLTAQVWTTPWLDVRLGRGDGTFGQRRGNPTWWYPGGIALADLDGDGKTDVAAACRGLGFMAGNADGTLGPFHVGVLGQGDVSAV